MKKIYLSLLVLLLFTATVYAQDLPQITIVNNTGYVITQVFISSSGDGSWGVNRLLEASLLRGHSVTLDFPFPLDAANRYNIRLTDSDGDTYTKINIRTSNHNRIVFTIDDLD